MEGAVQAGNDPLQDVFNDTGSPPRGRGLSRIPVSGAGVTRSGALWSSKESSTHGPAPTLLVPLPGEGVPHRQEDLEALGRQTPWGLHKAPPALGAAESAGKNGFIHYPNVPPPRPQAVSTVPKGARLSSGGRCALSSRGLSSAPPLAPTVPAAEAAQSAPPRRP